MTEDVDTKQRKSRSLVRTEARLKLTREHLQTVHDALRRAKRADNHAIINHATVRNSELGLQILYTHLNEYLKLILSAMFEKRPLQIVDKAQDTLQFQEIIRLGTYEAICHYMVDRVFRRLQNDTHSMGKFIEKLLARTDTKIDEKILNDALWYIEIRHLIVHNSGRIDKPFADRYAQKFQGVAAGNKLPINLGMAKKGITAVGQLCQTIDRELIARGYIDVN